MRLDALLFAVASVALPTGVLVAAQNISVTEYSDSAQTAFREGDYKRAAKLWEKAVKLDSVNPDLREGLGRAYERQAEASSFPLLLTTRARQNFVRALKLQPDHAAAMADLIELNQQPIGLCEGNLADASQLIDRLNSVDPDAAKRERDYWTDAKRDAARPGQMALCAPVKLSRAVTDHLVPSSKIPAAQLPKADSVVADNERPVATIGAGLN